MRAEHGEIREEIFWNGVALINTARALGTALGARLVIAGIVTLELKDPAPPGKVTTPAELEALLHDCEMGFMVRAVGLGGWPWVAAGLDSKTCARGRRPFGTPRKNTFTHTHTPPCADALRARL